MKINSRVGLSCLAKVDSDVIVEPLPKFQVIRDLVVDLRPRSARQS